MEQNKEKQLSSKEIYDLKRQESAVVQRRNEQKRTVKRVMKITFIVIIVGGSIGAFVWYLATRPPIPEGEILAQNGLHWHPELAIFVKGEKQEIPANIGIGVTHNPVHTHDSSGVIHLEFPGLVRGDDVKLGRFFKVWDRDLMTFGRSVRMIVNGEENVELQNYRMKDGDKIELRYE